ncbi:phosphatase PAP2 family protein [Roseateles sp. DC23W]|uniref:Phosphatase PAP2 family protein n=1 Tax=Pelomonas dachongensis TaxID=3299029 RepID=A0ABW7EJV8_9BURK
MTMFSLSPSSMPAAAGVLPTGRAWKTELAFTLLSLALLLLWDATSLDLQLARLWGTASGFALRDHWLASGVMHQGGRALSWALAGCLLMNVFRPLLRRQTLRERVWWLGVVVACVVLVPLLKRASPTSCPWDLAEFGGVAQYVSHWRLGVLDGGGGHCFPSGHASAAFAFIGGYFALKRAYPVAARRWLLGVLAAGLLFGLGQLARGAHYPSHTLWTAWICWTVAFATSSLLKAR